MLAIAKRPVNRGGGDRGGAGVWAIGADCGPAAYTILYTYSVQHSTMHAARVVRERHVRAGEASRVKRSEAKLQPRGIRAVAEVKCCKSITSLHFALVQFGSVRFGLVWFRAVVQTVDVDCSVE